MNVFAPGSTVMVGKIEVLILKVELLPKQVVHYQVVYWVDLERKEIWVSEIEVTAARVEKSVIFGVNWK